MDVSDTAPNDGSSTPLVLLHGWLDSRHTWDLVLPHHLSSHHRIIAVTFRGWGDASHDGTYSIDAYATDVIDLLESLSLSVPAVLVGHSMGTLVATAVAARAPDRVAGLILVGAAATMRPEHVLDPSDGTTCADIATMCHGWVTDGVDEDVLKSFQLDDLTPFVKDDSTPQPFADQVMVETLKADARAYGECWQSMLDENHTAELATIDTKVLIVWGSEDGIFVMKDQVALEEALCKADVWRVTVDGGPHGVLWTHAPKVADAMVDFLAAVTDSVDPKYPLMLKRGIPLNAVRQALARDFPMSAVQNALVRDELDSSTMDDNAILRNALARAERVKEEESRDPFTKYHKMLKMGLPMNAVKNAMVRDGRDPSICDGL